MNEALIIKSVFIFVSIWGIGIVMLWFRPRIEIFWKIIATLIFGFYIWFFLDEILRGLGTFKSEWYVASLQFLKEFITLVFVNMFFFWPLALILIFYKADDIGAEKLLKFLCLLTLILWIVFVIYFYFSSGIDKYLYENLKKIIPDAQ
jgi:Na+-driven multidrug efflux pump